MSIIPLEHSDLVGGSTAARRLACSPSYRLEQQVPKGSDDGSIHARIGSTFHEILAKVLQDDVDPYDLLPFTYTAPQGWSHTITEDDWADIGETALTMYDTFVVDTEKRLGADFVIKVETRVGFPGIPGAFGTSDIIAHCEDEIFILDWKMGQIIVDARENIQAAFYACAALETIPEFFPFEVVDSTPVTFVILQPAAGEPSVWRTDVAYLDQFAAELRAAIELAKVGGGEVNVGPHCKFARCQSICPKRVGAAQMLADRLDKLQALTTKGNAPVDRVIDIEAALAEILDLAEMVKPMLEMAEDTALRLMQDGREIPGYGLKAKRAGARKWIDDEQAAMALQDALGDDAMKISVISPAQAEKALKKAGYDMDLLELVEAPESSGFNVVKTSKMTGSSLVELSEKVARRLA